MTYLLIVSMDIEGMKEELFNEVYDTEHIPAILKVPGVISASRYKVEPMKMNFGSEVVIWTRPKSQHIRQFLKLNLPVSLSQKNGARLFNLVDGLTR